ncbi:MAG: hypothetical protein WAU81_09660 [Candidatus Aminicenantales bacterium]
MILPARIGVKKKDVHRRPHFGQRSGSGRLFFVGLDLGFLDGFLDALLPEVGGHSFIMRKFHKKEPRPPLINVKVGSGSSSSASRSERRYVITEGSFEKDNARSVKNMSRKIIHPLYPRLRLLKQRKNHPPNSLKGGLIKVFIVTKFVKAIE